MLVKFRSPLMVYSSIPLDSRVVLSQNPTGKEKAIVGFVGAAMVNVGGFDIKDKEIII